MKKGKSSVSTESPQVFLRQKILLQTRVPFSAATLWRKVKSGKFPRPVKIAKQIVAWRTSDVDEWESDPSGYTQRSSEVSS